MSDLNEIIPGLWVGNRNACTPFEGRALCVLEHHPCSPYKCLHMRILNDNGEASRHRLTQAAKIIHAWMQNNKPNPAKANAKNIERSRQVPVLVHCAAGVERSPLTVAWYLHLHKGMPLDEAYRLLIEKRPEVEDRQHWLEAPLFEGSVLA